MRGNITLQEKHCEVQISPIDGAAFNFEEGEVLDHDSECVGLLHD